MTVYPSRPEPVATPPRARRKRPRVLMGVSVGAVAVLMAGYGVHVASAAEAPVVLSDRQLTEAMIGPAIRVTRDSAAYYRSVVSTAELLDWRAANRTAPAADVTAHLDLIDGKIADGVKNPDTLLLEPAELLGRQLKAVFGTRGAKLDGPEVTRLLAVATTRDAATTSADAEPVAIGTQQRLSGAIQRWGVDIPYAYAQNDMWIKLHSDATADPALAGAWQAVSGAPTPEQPTGVDPTWSFTDIVDNVKPLEKLVDVKALVTAGQKGATAFFDELKKQMEALSTKLNGQQSELSTAIENLLTTAGLPGKAGERGPTADQLKQAAKEQAGRQGLIDGIKGGLDVLVGIVAKVDPKFAKQLGGYVETAYKIATAGNQLFTAIQTLATSTSMGATTFGVIGAALGAGIGIVQLILSLTMGDDADPQAKAQAAMVDAVQKGFTDLQTRLQQMYDVMNQRFDRVDAQLKTIYTQMMTEFGAVLRSLNDIQAGVDTANAKLVELSDRMQSVQTSMVKLFQASAIQPFWETANQYVDFAVKNRAQPTATEYRDAANRFHTVGTITARSDIFRQTDLDDPDTTAVLAAKGPDGSIDYLLNQARDEGVDLPQTGTTPNADLWALAARAYTLMAVQNPDLAAAEGTTRIDDLVADGRLILTNTQLLGRPAADGSPSALFTNLLTENADLRAKLPAALEKIGNTSIPASRPYRLWDTTDGATAFNQGVDFSKVDFNLTATVSCPKSDQMTRPVPLKGTSLSPELALGAYLAGNWTIAACPIGQPKQGKVTVKAGARSEGPPGKPTMQFYEKSTTYSQDWDEYAIPGPGQRPILGGRATLVSNQVKCSWKEVNDVPGDCDFPDTTGGFAGVVKNVPVPFAGKAQAEQQLNLKRKLYYQAIAAKLNTKSVSEVNALNKNMELLQAYSTLAFPRAKESDEQMSALLYGTNALPANLPSMPILTALYTSASDRAGANKTGSADQPLLDSGADGQGCPETKGGDPVSACVVRVGGLRQDDLLSRYAIHARALSAGTAEETSPLVSEALRNLELVQQFLRARRANS